MLALGNRFWKKVDKTNGCWNWTACTCKGYGGFRMVDKMEAAHRLSWESLNGEIPKGLYVLHKCDNRGCVNPSHLFLGTHNDNMRDMVDKGRVAHGIDAARSKLTEGNVIDIRRIYKLGKTKQKALAKMFNISRASICLLLSSKTWHRLEG